MRDRRGFTLVELLVVVGIVALLIAMLLSAIVAARRQANMVVCAANLGNLAKVFLAYANDQGAFPPNTILGNACWTSEEVIGPYAAYAFTPGLGASYGGLVCAELAESSRSYAMNVWASSTVDASILALSPTYGTFWKPSATPASQLILAVESYASSGGTPGIPVYAPPFVGQRGNSSAHRFGALGGVTPVRLPSRRFVPTELEWRHVQGNQAKVNLAFADGHVGSFTQADLVRADGTLTGEAYWMPSD